MAIYDLGTASLAANGEVTGVGTTWKAPLTLIRVGATIVFKTEPVQIYTISEIISDTQINVYNPNSETVPAGTGYAILAHDGITVQGLAQDVAETLRYYQSRETEVSVAVDIFKDFDPDKFSADVNQVNTQFGEIVTIGSQVSSDASKVSADKDAAYASSILAQNSANIAESAAESVSGALVGNFDDGVTLQSENQVIIQFIDGYARQFLWSGSLPKVVPAGSTPESSGGIGPGAWVSVGDASLRSNLADSDGSSLIKYGDGTLKDYLDSLSNKSGFNAVGRFLNIAELREATPSTEGEIVFVASAASASATEKHYGGGYFQSFDNSASPISDDGGIVIVPATGTLAWQRINFTDVELVFWGVKPDTGLDFSAQILKAMTYVRNKKCKIKFPIGVVTSNDALPIWSESSIEGHGRAASKFIKLTNNVWNVSEGVSIDAICVCLPDVYDRYGGSMDTFCVKPRISGISLERVSTTSVNKPAYGIWGSKLAGANFSDMLVLGGNIGFYANIAFLMIQEQVSYSGVTGSYAGVYIENADSTNTRALSAGTTCYFKQVGVSGYGFGFYLSKLNSTRLVQCDAEALSRATGETECAAYIWRNPENCTMDNCYTESVDGAMIKVSNVNDVSIANNLVISGMNISGPNPGESFSQPTRLITIDSNSAGILKVTFIGGDLRFASPGFTNMLPSLAGGSNCEVKLLGSSINTWDTVGGATVTQL